MKKKLNAKNVDRLPTWDKAKDYILGRTSTPPVLPPLPTDREICTLVYRLWDRGLNLELRNIAACMASKQRVIASDSYVEFMHTRLKALVRSHDLRRVRFLPGRPAYHPS